MRTFFHRQNKNRAESEQVGVGGVVGEMGLLYSHDPHRLQVHLWGQRRQRRSGLGIPNLTTGTPRQDIRSYSGAEAKAPSPYSPVCL